MAAAPRAAARETLVWSCGECKAECFPITDQSFCLCTHRANKHVQGGSFPCAAAGCDCAAFYYIIVQGSWRLRCSCKHLPRDHSVSGDHACSRAKCGCERFVSPFVCGCDHRWADHVQTVEMRAPKTLAQMVRQAGLEATGGTVLRRGDAGGGAAGDPETGGA